MHPINPIATTLWRPVVLVLAILVLPSFSTDASLRAQTPVWGTLNTSSADSWTYNSYTTSADGWIAKAEAATGDSGTSCTSTALTYEEQAEDAFLQWKTTDAGNDVALVEIAAKWQYYQPNWDSGTPANDPCYQRFLTNVIEAYKSAGYVIAFTVALEDGPSWLNSSTNCPNCLFVSYDGKNPSYYNGSTLTTRDLPNVVFDDQVRLLAGTFIDSAFTLATDAVQSVVSGSALDYVRIGLSENGETMYPAALLKTSGGSVTYENEWWAFDGAAQAYSTANLRAPTIPDPPDCLFGWYPGAGAPTTTAPASKCTIPTGLTALQATEAWWAWYFNALADAHAWVYYRFRHDNSYSGPIAFVTPGSGVVPDKLIPYLTYIADSDWTDYDSQNPYETVNEAAAWWVFYDQVIYQLHNAYSLSPVGAMRVDISSVQADSNPSYSGTAMNPIAKCNDGGTDSAGSISPSPTYSTSFTVNSSGYTYSGFPSTFDDWSSVRMLTYVAGISSSSGLPTMGENAGSNPYSGSLSGSTYTTGMKDVVTLIHSCGTGALMWAFDYQLNSGSSSYASGTQYKSCITGYPTCP